MSGGRKRTVSNEEILSLFLSVPDPILSTQEVADEFEFSQAGILTRLRELEELGYLESKKVGNSNAWWLTEDGQEFVSPEDSEK